MVLLEIGLKLQPTSACSIASNQARQHASPYSKLSTSLSLRRQKTTKNNSMCCIGECQLLLQTPTPPTPLVIQAALTLAASNPSA